MNNTCFAHGRDTVPIFILKTSFPCTEGITKRGWDPGHSQSQKLTIPSQFCRKSCVVFSLSPCPLISPPPLPVGACGAVRIQPWLSERELTLLSLYLIMSESPERLLPPPALLVPHSSDCRAARSELSCVVSWLFSEERKERGSCWALGHPCPSAVSLRRTWGREGEGWDEMGWEH